MQVTVIIPAEFGNYVSFYEFNIRLFGTELHFFSLMMFSRKMIIIKFIQQSNFF